MKQQQQQQQWNTIVLAVAKEQSIWDGSTEGNDVRTKLPHKPMEHITMIHC